MAPRYNLDADLVGSDRLTSISPHWVVGFARYANPITYSPVAHASITKDINFAYQERTPLVVDDLGDCCGMTIQEDKKSHTHTMTLTLVDSGTKYINEVLPGDWVVANIVYSLDEARRISKAMRTPGQVNKWDDGFKFLGRVQDIQKRIMVSPAGVPSSVYNITCVAFSEFDSTVMYYPQLVYSDSIPVSMEKFGSEVSGMIRGDETNEFGAIDINRIIPKLMTVLFGVGAWGSQSFRNEPLTPNLAYIVPQTVCTWLGIQKSRGTFADIMRVMVGVEKYGTAANATNSNASPGALFWPDGASLSENAYRCPFKLVGSFPAQVVPQTTTTPWAFVTNYSNPPLNETLVTLRPTKEGVIFPFLTVRQTPYTSEVGAEFDRAAYQLEQNATREQSQATSKQKTTHTPTPQPNRPRAAVFTRLPTTRFLELPRWVVSTASLKEAVLGRSDMMRQNLVFVFGSGPGVAMSEQDQFVNAGPVKDDLDIYRFGIRPYMPSVNSFLRDVALVVTDWRDLMSDIVMGQHLTLNGSMTITGVRAPIAPGTNLQFENVVYHIESVTHSCSIAPNGDRDFTTRLALSRGVVDSATVREEQFPNVRPDDPEGPPQGITKD